MNFASLPDDAVAAIFDGLSRAPGWTGTAPHGIPSLARSCRRFAKFYRETYITGLHLVDVPSTNIARALTRFPRVNRLNIFFYGRVAPNIPVIFGCPARGVGITKLAIEASNVRHSELQRIVAACPLLVSLKIEKRYFGDVSVETVNTMSALRPLNETLEVLSLSRGGGNISDEGGQPIGTLLRLNELDLSWCGGLGHKTFESLSNLSRLRRLTLTGTNISSESARAMFHGLVSLTALDVSSCSNLTSIAVSAMPSSLEYLYAHSTRILQDANSVADMTHLDRLQELHARNCTVLFDWAGLTTLTSDVRVLNVSGAPLCDDGAYDALARFSLLEKLELGGCDIGDDAAKAIGSHLRCLRELRINRTEVSDAGAQLIAEGECVGTLKLLDMQWCPYIRDKSSMHELFASVLSDAVIWI